MRATSMCEGDDSKYNDLAVNMARVCYILLFSKHTRLQGGLDTVEKPSTTPELDGMLPI